MRVVTWNMGLADRTRRFVRTREDAWRFLLDLNPDLAFIQETFPPDWVDADRIVRDPFRKWGSLVFGPTLDITPFALPEGDPLRALPNYLAFGEVGLGDGLTALLASVHAPPRRAEGDVLGGRDPKDLLRSVDGPRFNDAIFAALAPLVEGRRFILAGDWNTARRQRTERESRAGEEFFERVRRAGWHDCTWEKLDGEIRTWFGPGAIQQDDYVFTDQTLGERVERVWVAADAVDERHLSDHAPLIVEFADS
jgi:endonuclease/exonuclease/phosphatase family metal-dependent hydrolase